MDASGENPAQSSPSSTAQTPQSSPQSAAPPPAPHSNEENAQSRKPGQHKSDCVCLICERKRTAAEKKSNAPNAPGKLSGESSASLSNPKSHHVAPRSTSRTMAHKIAAMSHEQHSKAKPQSPQSAAEQSLAQSPGEGNWFTRLFSGWATIFD